MSNSSSMSDSSMSDGSSGRGKRTTKQFERAIRNRTNRAIGTKDGHHFRHKVPVFVATKAMEEYLASGATDEQAREMQEQLITMMSDPMVGSMDPEDDNKLDSMYEAVYRSVNRHSKDRATSNAAFDDVFNKPTPSQKQLIDTYDIRSAQELRDLAGDHVQEGVDALRSMYRKVNFSYAAVCLMCAQYLKPYLNHFRPAHQEGTPNRGKILSRTLEERKLNLDMRCLSIVEAKIADRNRGARDEERRVQQQLEAQRQAQQQKHEEEQREYDSNGPIYLFYQPEGEELRRWQERTSGPVYVYQPEAEVQRRVQQRNEEAQKEREAEAQRQAQQQKREEEQRVRDEERRVQQQLEAQRQAQQQKREAEQRVRDEERRMQQQLEAQRQVQQQRQQYVYRQQAEMQRISEFMSYLNYPVSHSFNSYTPQQYFSSGRSSSPSISYSSHYSSPQVHTHSVSPPGTRAGSEWDVFRSANKGLGWTRAEMSENYRNRNDF